MVGSVDAQVVEGDADPVDDGDEPVRALAVGDLLEGAAAQVDDLDPVVAEAGEQVGLVADVLRPGPAGRAEEVLADVDGAGTDPGRQGEADLLVALDEGLTGLLAGAPAPEPEQALEARVGR